MVNNCEQQLKDIKFLLDKVFHILNGKDANGGLVTEVQLLKQQFKDLPTPSSLKFYASFGGSIVMALGFLGYAIFHFFKTLGDL